MRLMSFALTTQQIHDGTKTVTRRLGWLDVKPGELICACAKVMGRNGAPLERLRIIRVISVRREPLSAIDDDDVWAEGFNMPAHEFVDMFCDAMQCHRSDPVTRIEFRYVPGGRF